MLIRSFGGSAARLVFAAFAIFACSAAAEAQYITYVATNGNDANACTVITAPCKTLQRAVTATSANGTVRVLTPLTSSVFINKSITIEGVRPTIVGQITIGSATAIVTLRGLALNGVGGYANGIRIDSAATVHIEDCTVERYTGSGVKLSASTATELFVSNTVARDNVGSGLEVVDGNAVVAISDSRFDNNYMGVWLTVARASIVRVEASRNNVAGIRLEGGMTADVSNVVSTENQYGFDFRDGVGASLVSVVARGNADGLYMYASSVSVIDSLFTGNPTSAIHNQDGTLYTRQNNTLGGNYLGNAAIPYNAF